MSKVVTLADLAPKVDKVLPSSTAIAIEPGTLALGITGVALVGVAIGYGLHWLWGKPVASAPVQSSPASASEAAESINDLVIEFPVPDAELPILVCDYFASKRVSIAEIRELIFKLVTENIIYIFMRFNEKLVNLVINRIVFFLRKRLFIINFLFC